MSALRLAQPSGEAHRIAMLSAAAYAGMFVFGIVMALLGAVLPLLAGRLEFRLADIGTLFVAMNGAMLASSLLLGLAMDRFGMKPPLALGPLVVAGALMLVARAAVFTDLLPAAALLGLGGGALNGATNTLVADLHDDPRRKSAALNLLGVFFGIGALFLPFAIGALLARFPIAVLLDTAAALCAAAGVFAWMLRFPPPKQANALPLADMPRFLRAPLVLVLGLVLFFESGAEFTLGGFISTYLTREVGASSVSVASWILAVYWASILLARIVMSRVVLAASPYRVLQYCALGACAGTALAAAAPTLGIAAFAIALIGWSLSAIYPTVFGIAGASYQSHSGTVFGILLTIALAGGMAVPFVAGRIGGAVGLRWVFVLLAGCYLAMTALGRVAARLHTGID